MSDELRDFARALLGAPRNETDAPDAPAESGDEMQRFVRDLFTDTDD